MTLRTVGDLLTLLANVPLDKPIEIHRSAPPSANPCSFEDEYGPGVIQSVVHVQLDHPSGAVVLWEGGPTTVAVEGGG